MLINPWPPAGRRLDPVDRMLESDEAARRLGIKVASLYAYVSRGLLVSHPAPEGRKRLFALDDVEALARRSRQGKSVETRMVTITTAVTQLTDDGPLYRGARATDLATTASFEEVADRLWGDTDPGRAVRGHGTPDVGPVAAGGPRPTPGPGAVGPVALGGGHGRRPRSTAVRPPSRGGHPYRRPDRRLDGRRPALARPNLGGPNRGPSGAPRRSGSPPRHGRPASGPTVPPARPGPGPGGQCRPGPVGRP